MKRTSVRLLRQWRRDALQEIELIKDWETGTKQAGIRRVLNNRILIMTQELLDLQMMEEKSD